MSSELRLNGLGGRAGEPAGLGDVPPWVAPTLRLKDPRDASKLTGLSADGSLELRGGMVRLGNRNDCEIKFRVWLGARREYARILRVGEDHYVEDLAGKSTTLINGETVAGMVQE